MESNQPAEHEQELSAQFNHFAESDSMDFLSFEKFAISYGLISNSCTLGTLSTVFKQIGNNRHTLTVEEFIQASISLFRKYNPASFSPAEDLIARFRSARSAVPVIDEKNEILLSFGAISEYKALEQGFFTLLVQYNTTNINKRRRVIGPNHVVSDNLGISARNLLRFCRILQVVPEFIPIETVAEHLQAILPSSFDLVSGSTNDHNFSKLVPLKPVPGEPELKLMHLQLMLGRIGLDVVTYIEDPICRVRYFLKKILKLPKLEFFPYPIDYLEESDMDPFESHQEILNNYRKKKLVSSKGIKEDFDLLDVVKELKICEVSEVLKFIEKERIEPVPALPTFNTERPAPLSYPLVPAGEPPAPEPPTQFSLTGFKFFPLPGTMPKQLEQQRHEKMSEIHLQMQQGLIMQTSKQMNSNIGIQPYLLTEVLFPSNAPDSVRELLGKMAFNISQCKYATAYLQIDEAKKLWTEPSLTTSTDIFFEYSKASVFLAAGKFQLALSVFYGMKSLFSKLVYSHPDRALFYCGLGTALSHLEYHEPALRCFLQAKSIRERLVGGDTIDTATVYNNLGVEFCFLQRFEESIAYLKLSYCIYLNMLGPPHPRSMIVKQNIKKVERFSFNPHPDNKPLWTKQFQDPYFVAKKKKKAKKKK